MFLKMYLFTKTEDLEFIEERKDELRSMKERQSTQMILKDTRNDQDVLTIKKKTASLNIKRGINSRY